MSELTHKAAVLLVDDEPEYLNVISELLSTQGYRVFTAKSGAQAINIWQSHGNEIDLLITDLVMPAMRGSELAAHLRTHRPDLKILFTSGSGIAMVESLIYSFEKPYEFLPKPFRGNDLVGAIENILSAK